MEKKIRGGGSSRSSSERQSAQALGGRIKARNRQTVHKITTKQVTIGGNNDQTSSRNTDKDISNLINGGDPNL